MSAQTASIILLSAGVGFCIPHLWNFVTWQRGKNRRPEPE